MAATRRDELADAIRDTLTSPNVPDDNLEPSNVVDAFVAAARIIARALDRLGNADASTSMGGLEAHGAAMLQAAERIGSGLERLAEAVETAGESVCGGCWEIANEIKKTREEGA